MPLLPLLLASLLLPLAAAEAKHDDAAKAGGIPVSAPSANRGRREIYHVQTGLPGYSYNVDAKHIDPAQPAGICLFIPGQGARDESPWFDQWEQPVLQAHRLIGINMAWKDGDNTRDTVGKLDACRIAIGQVCADYKVVLGRGVLAAFSGGGVPQGLWWSTDGAKGARDFPFCHLALWSTNFRTLVGATPRVGWTVSVGTREWTLADLGGTQTSVYSQLVQGGAKGSACLDAYLSIQPKEHEITNLDGAAVGEQFARTDVAFAPFLYEPDFAASPLAARAAQAANLQAIGEAQAAVAKGLAAAKTPEAERAVLEALRARLAERAAAKVALVATLADADPLLALYYAKILAPQVGKDDAKAIAAGAARAAKTAATAGLARTQALYIGLFPGLFGGSPVLKPEQKQALDAIAPAGPPTALTARMAREFAVLPVTGR